MPMRIRAIGVWIGLLLAGTMVLAPAAPAQERSELVQRINRSETFIRELMKTRDTAIPPYVWQSVRGILVFRQYKVGLVLGFKGGYGIAMVRDRETNRWSPPAFYRTAEGSIGYQIGGQAVNSVYLLMDREALEMLVKSEFKIGGDIAASAGPVGRQAEAKLGQSTPILAYSKSEGLFVGASVEGGWLMADNHANRVFYNRAGLKSREILFEEAVEMPDAARPLVDLLNLYAGGTTGLPDSRG